MVTGPIVADNRCPHSELPKPKRSCLVCLQLQVEDLQVETVEQATRLGLLNVALLNANKLYGELADELAKANRRLKHAA